MHKPAAELLWFAAFAQLHEHTQQLQDSFMVTEKS